MKPTWRLIDTGPLDPFSNMAFDETLLRGYECHGAPPTFRIYGWEPAGISLGFAQDPEKVLDLGACRRGSMPFVRRLTGGGMIAHGDELTYSFVCSKEDLGISGQIVSSYKTIASFLIRFYESLGINASFACDVPSDDILGVPSALCFSAKEKYDIVVDGRKIGGSAQKRSSSAIFQHGSIPLRVDMERTRSFLRVQASGDSGSGVTSLKELLGRSAEASELTRALTDAFARTFGASLRAGQLSEAEKIMCAELKSLKYASRQWNYERIDVTEERDHRCRPAARAAELAK